MRHRNWKLKRLVVVAVGCSAALFLFGGVPASADNGPHVKGASPNMISDACASCHRAHTAKAAYLLKQSQDTLCFTCHGTGVLGANTDVQDGVGYSGTDRSGGAAGALRGGGFDYALIDSANPTAATGAANVPVLSAGAATTSTHSIDDTAQTAWGNGPTSVTANYGKSIDLECGTCHDPHGNGNYRILRKIPVSSGATPGTGITDPTTKVYTTDNYWKVWDVEDTTEAWKPPSGGRPGYTTVTGPFIASIAAWCSTCHTRYDAPSGSYKVDSGDAVFAYRHSSNYTYMKKDGGGRPNCIQCHVSHGSNASMGANSSSVNQPDGSAAATGGSRLLRVDNRGTCQMCHKK